MRATRPLPLHVSVLVSVSQSKSPWRAAGPGGLVRASHEGNEAVAPPCFGIGIGIGIAIEIAMEGRRPGGLVRVA